jgi:hypothetical protein
VGPKKIVSNTTKYSISIWPPLKSDDYQHKGIKHHSAGVGRTRPHPAWCSIDSYFHPPGSTDYTLIISLILQTRDTSYLKTAEHQCYRIVAIPCCRPTESHKNINSIHLCSATDQPDYQTCTRPQTMKLHRYPKMLHYAVHTANASYTTRAAHPAKWEPTIISVCQGAYANRRGLRSQDATIAHQLAATMCSLTSFL